MMLNQFVWGLQLELARFVSLHYPKSSAQAVSLAETTKLAAKPSRRPVGKNITRENQSRGQISQIGAEDDGAIRPVVTGDVEVDPGVKERILAEEDVVLLGSLP